MTRFNDLATLLAPDGRLKTDRLPSAHAGLLDENGRLLTTKLPSAHETLLDGDGRVQSSLMPLRLNEVCPSISGTDLNDLDENGWFEGEALVNSPDGTNAWFQVMNMRHSNTGNPHGHQYAAKMTNLAEPGVPEVYFRQLVAGTWYAWIRLADTDRLRGGLGGIDTSGVQDWNDPSHCKPGSNHTLMRGSWTNGPGAGAYYHLLVFEYQRGGGSGNITQVAIPYYANSVDPRYNAIWVRTRYNGTWTAWCAQGAAVYGANSNGKYIKFADGQMFAWYEGSRTDIAIDSSYGSNLWLGSFSWTYPAAFYVPPTVSVGMAKWGTSASWGGLASSGSATAASIRIYDVLQRAAGTTTYLEMMAMGRWY